MIKNNIKYKLIKDQLGSIRLVVNTLDGTIVSSVEYGEFGKINHSTKVRPNFQSLGFAGGLRDPATGLVRFGARDYDPQIGRWTAKDPIGFSGGDSNLYGYVIQDPINFIDPEGKSLKTTYTIAIEIIVIGVALAYLGKTLRDYVKDLDSDDQESIKQKLLEKHWRTTT